MNPDLIAGAVVLFLRLMATLVALVLCLLEAQVFLSQARRDPQTLDYRRSLNPTIMLVAACAFLILVGGIWG